MRVCVQSETFCKARTYHTYAYILKLGYWIVCIIYDCNKSLTENSATNLTLLKYQKIKDLIQQRYNNRSEEIFTEVIGNAARTFVYEITRIQ